MTDIALRHPAMADADIATSAGRHPTLLARVTEAFETKRVPSLLARMARAFEAAQQRRVEREVARIIALNGGLISDDVERRIARQFGL
jgi:hypothetical protein